MGTGTLVYVVLLALIAAAIIVTACLSLAIHNEKKPTGKATLSHNTALRIVKIMNTLLMTLCFSIVWYYYYLSRTDAPFYAKGSYAMVFLFFVLYAILGKVYDAFNMSHYRVSEMVYSQALASGAADFILYIVICFLSKGFPNLLPGIICWVVQIAVAVHWSMFSKRWYFATFKRKSSAVIYDRDRGIQDLLKESDLSKKFDVQKVMTAEECIADLSQLHGIDTVFVGGVHSHERNIILKYCVAHNIRMYVIPRVGDVIMNGARPTHMFHLPVLMVGRYNPSPEYLAVKRLFDILVSGVAFIIFSPIMLIAAIAIKATDHGPIIYKQVRLTQNGREFNILKFRSMRVDAEKDGVARLSSGDKDDRITPVGKIIRACRVDEMPQLINILKGDLSIVGPRPERPQIHKQYCEQFPEFDLRLQCKAGLTGFAQVYGQYNTQPYDKLQMDLLYIAHPSFIEDLKICFGTVKILFMKDSTEGVAEGQTTAAK
ncbi:MAG: sugar transferase [Lachnospiraceae bacterium]|nr:sugar transferase [Lachnospiraceae bacterium]